MKAKADRAGSSALHEEREESNLDDLMALADLKLRGASNVAAAEQLPKGALSPALCACCFGLEGRSGCVGSSWTTDCLQQLMRILCCGVKSC